MSLFVNCAHVYWVDFIVIAPIAVQPYILNVIVCSVIFK